MWKIGVVMSQKTMGDYMRMMKSVEKADSEEEVNESECQCDGECECNGVNESVQITGIDPIYTECQTFEKYTSDMISKFKDFISSDINDHVDLDEDFTCGEYLIIGITLEQGLMVILKCKNEFDEEKNLYFEIGTEGIEYKGEI